MIQARMIVKLFGKVKKEGDWYISYCPALDVYSQGKSEKKALNNLIEATSLFLMSCYDRGVLDEALHDCGFMAVKSTEKMKSEKDMIPIDVPIPLIAKRNNGRSRSKACHA